MNKKNNVLFLLRKGNKKLLFLSTIYFLFTPIWILYMCFFVIVFTLSFQFKTLKELFRWCLLGYYNAGTAYKNFFKPQSYKPLKNCSENTELLDFKNYQKRGFYITNTFIIISKFFSFNIIPKNKIVWGYIRKETNILKYRNSFVGTTTAQTLILKSDIKFSYTYPIKNRCRFYNTYAQEINLEEVIKELSHIVWGYNAIYEKIYIREPQKFIHNINNMNIIEEVMRYQ